MFSQNRTGNSWDVKKGIVSLLWKLLGICTPKSKKKKAKTIFFWNFKVQEKGIPLFFSVMHF